jgi:peptide/nickel transport system substrate-binding protein
VPIIPQHLWESVTEPDTFVNNIGSGPFKLAEYRPDQLYRFTANADHFAGAPAVGELLMPVIKDQTTIFSALRTGEINGTTVALTPELIQEFQNVPNLAVETGPGYATTMLMFNAERAPWDKLEVRRAVALAIDPQMLVDTVLLGYGAAGNPGWLHPSSPFHDPTIAGTTDLPEAQALLDGLGYTDSDGDGVREADGQPMVAELLVQSNSPLRIRSAELIAAALKELGITINVTALEPDSVTAKVWPDFDVAKGRDFDLSMWGWSAPLQLSPTRMASLVHSDPTIGTSNIGGYRNPEADALADQLLTVIDPEQQQTLANEMEALIASELPFVMLFYADGNYVYRSDVYDQWMYQTGQGIFHKLSFQPTALN